MFGAIRQAVQLAPCYPESYNLNGLAFEAQLDYHSAVAAYRLARLTVSDFSNRVSRSHVRDISINLARSLCMVKFIKFPFWTSISVCTVKPKAVLFFSIHYYSWMEKCLTLIHKRKISL